MEQELKSKTETRVIKFRAWDSQHNKMFSAAEMGADELQLNPDGRGFFNASSTSTRLSIYYPHLIPLQFTGLLDKNGKEIYEGDIVTFLDGSYISTENGIDANEFISTGVIEWCGERKGWDVTNREDVDTDECFDEYMEVIGNIYENPELLVKGKN